MSSSENDIILNIELFDKDKKSFFKKGAIQIDDCYIVIKDSKEIEKLGNQSEIKNELLLFNASISPNNVNIISLYNVVVGNNIYQKKSIFDEIDKNNLWYIIQSEKIEKINDKYFLVEGDIIKLGNKKFLINEIKIINYDEKEEQNEKEDSKGNNNYSNFNENAENFFGEISKAKKCKLCPTYNVPLCECNKKSHFSCFQYDEDQKNDKSDENKKKKNDIIIKNIEKNNKICAKSFHIKNFFCKNCKCQYSFQYKIKNKDFPLESIKIKRQYDDYIIMESLDDNDKTVFIIYLNESIIKIGKSENSDIIIEDESIKNEHAVIKYDKKNGKVWIESLSNDYYDFDNAVLVREEILVNSDKILLKINDNVLIANAQYD